MAPARCAARLAVYPLHSGVPDEVPQLLIDDDYAFRRIFDDQLEEEPFAAQPFLYLLTLGDVPGCGHYMVVAVQLLGHAHKHDVDRASHARHCSPRHIALIFTCTDTRPHQAQWQLSLLWTEDFFDDAANDLVVTETVGTFGCAIEIGVHEAAIGDGPGQRQPIRRVIEDRLDLGSAGPS